MVRLRSTVQFKLKSLAVMNLNTLFTLMLYFALEKNNGAFRAFAYPLACHNFIQLVEISKKMHNFHKRSRTTNNTSLIKTDLASDSPLQSYRKLDKFIKFSPYKYWDCSLHYIQKKYYKEKLGNSFRFKGRIKLNLNSTWLYFLAS